jgi:hypothetical protein
MDNLLYIVIGIAWVGYSLYSARQKALQKQQSAGLPPAGPSSSSPLPIPGNQGGGKTLFDDILRELTGEPRSVPQPGQAVKTVTPAQPSRAAKPSESIKSYTSYTPIPNVPTEFQLNDYGNDRKTHALHEQLTNNERISRKFNLREAVIFSELLNRKYF